ncbi:MAG: cryptochrome/photolyase family protein [Rubrivivax sp.]
MASLSTANPMPQPLRHLVIVLGDQLDRQASAWDGFDTTQDAAWMAEVVEESTHVPSSRVRTAMFLAAMRHFARELLDDGVALHYRRLDDPANLGSLGAELRQAVTTLRPQGLVLSHPGDWRVLQALKAVAAQCQLPLHVREDRHFLCSLDSFAAHAASRRQLRLEFFYRDMRRRHGVLINPHTGEPEGGQWNFDADNRESFGKDGPPGGPGARQAPTFPPDGTTREVLALVNERFPTHVGELATFAWPVTRAQALQALARFIDERLVHFGRWQDALWPAEPWLWHSQLSAALNLKLLNPLEVVRAAEQAGRAGRVSLASAEGFIRQILGWREYVRGIYWQQMPGYTALNTWDAQEPLPAFYWTGRTPMACMADALVQTLRLGYAHHIQRLMVTGLYALLLGVRPQAVHEWYLSVYVDAVEWVELPNTLGMSQAADGGLMASKPYIASGLYIERQSAGSLCARCRFKPSQRTGEQACPFTTLYWDFLMRHETVLARNPRTVMQVRNLQRVAEPERVQIRARAQAIRDGALDTLPPAVTVTP